MELITLAKQAILRPSGITESEIDTIMGRLLSSRADAADIYFQSTRAESWVMEGGIIKEGSHNIAQGAGVRAVSGDKTGFAYSDKIELPVLLEAANNVKSIVRQAQNASMGLALPPSWPSYYAPLDPIKSLEDQ